MECQDGKVVVAKLLSTATFVPPRLNVRGGQEKRFPILEAMDSEPQVVSLRQMLDRLCQELTKIWQIGACLKKVMIYCHNFRSYCVFVDAAWHK